MLATVLGPSLRWRSARAAFFVVVAFIICLPMTGWVSPLGFFNYGASMATGLYVFSHAPPAAVGEVIVIANPEHFKGSWLMKRVQGVAGDYYCWDAVAGRHTINDRLMPAPSPEAKAMGVPVWTGCRVLAKGEVVGYGDGVESFDSRYFGPVQESKLHGIYRPVWVW